ncbi:SDR family oxidoreductase [Chitinimonas lacunae]|uniref:SDR family oxidoreductase n=1 Tax=Chitinimonas lacunae TaxID=1963018 RepID=A0ABV8MNU2_9NEIS
MRILIVGSSGFLGGAIAAALHSAGHEVVGTARRPAAGTGLVEADFARDHDPAVWRSRLAGFDAVVNAVGILRESPGQHFDDLHQRGPCALFSACVAAGVPRVVQISALGADAAATSRYHLSKQQADDFLLSLPLTATVLQPSLVYGPGGTSARLFDALAALPLIPLPGQGRQLLQPIHLDDLCATVVKLLEMPAPPRRLAAVGPAALTLRDYLATLRRALGLGRGCFINVPNALVDLAATLGEKLPGALLDRDTLTMLERGNHADAGPISAVLGHPPRPPANFVAAREVRTARLTAQLDLLLPMLRLSLAVVWIVTAVVSVFFYPVTDSLELLARTGISGAAGPLALYGAAGLDLLFGLGMLFLPRRRLLYKAQIGLILFYTLTISLFLPEFWFHPYGPLLKNLPMLAVLWVLHDLEE